VRTADRLRHPLDLRGTGQFVDWFHTIELNESAQALEDSALSALVAPCCNDDSAATCCCECNLTRSAWGLPTSSGMGRSMKRAFAGPPSIRSDLRAPTPTSQPSWKRGVDSGGFGLTTYDSCHRGITEFLVTEGGCAGMAEVIEPGVASLLEVTPPEENECLDDDPRLLPIGRSIGRSSANPPRLGIPLFVRNGWWDSRLGRRRALHEVAPEQRHSIRQGLLNPKKPGWDAPPAGPTRIRPIERGFKAAIGRDGRAVDHETSV
jgi:hypothetical protein